MYSRNGTNVWGQPAAKQPVVESAWARPVTKQSTKEIESITKNAEISDNGPNIYEMHVEMGRLRTVVDGLRERTEKMQAELYANEGRFESMQKELDVLRFSVNTRPLGSVGWYSSGGPRAR